MRTRGRRAHLFLAAVAVLWLFPLGWAVYASLRPYADTAARGYVSLPGTLTLDNYAAAVGNAELPRYMLNTFVVAVPAVALILLLGSVVAFVVARFSWRFNLGLLLLFTAGNLLPPQALITPLYRLYLAVPIPPPLSDNGRLYDQVIGIIAIHVAFQLGFAVFVLSNWMKTLPGEVLEAALVDGASAVRVLTRIVLPMSRPALAALGTLQFTWIYNDFFWALLLMRSGDRRPVTSALLGLSGQYFTDTNLLAAGAVLVALPTVVVFLALQRHFSNGLALGVTRG